MMATNNSRADGPRAKARRPGSRRCIAMVPRPTTPIWLLATALCLSQIKSISAERDARCPESDSARCAYLAARERFQRDTNDVAAAWQFARTCFDWADFSPNNGQREQTANEGIAASRQAIKQDPMVAAGHYYLAFNLGQLARTKLLGALPIVREMERELKSARDLDERFDFAGPDRTLGQLYFDAPGWPTSIGDKARARKHLERAVELNDRYPDNQLLLMEASFDSRQKESLQRLAETFEASLPGMRLDFNGDKWASSWPDWDRRWKVIKDKLEKLK